MLKPIVAHAGDTVEVSAHGIAVNGTLLHNTSPRTRDSQRTTPHAVADSGGTPFPRIRVGRITVQPAVLRQPILRTDPGFADSPPSAPAVGVYCRREWFDDAFWWEVVLPWVLLHGVVTLAAIPLSLLIFLLLGFQQTRTRALGLMVSYYAGATWQLIPGAATFFGDHANPVHAVLLWVGASLLLGLAWLPLWSQKRGTRLYTIPMTICLVAVPPLGLIGVASPLTAAGILLPGTAWFGLLLTLLICGLLASYPIAGIALTIICSVPAQLVYHEPQAPSDWQAVTTHFGGVGLDTRSPLAEYTAAQSIQQTALRSPAHVIVFPESVVSNWNEATDTFWASTFELLKREGKTILVGANISDT